MLCSARELGLGQEHDGILELDTDAAPGTPLLDALPLADHRLVVDVTPNRPDLLGHKGVARELAASYQTPFRLPAIPGADAARRSAAAPRAAPRGQRRRARPSRSRTPRPAPAFTPALIRGVTGRAVTRRGSAQRLEAVGVRSINNVVDATNYVMLELNQPMHAYDAAKLRGGGADRAARARRASGW